MTPLQLFNEVLYQNYNHDLCKRVPIPDEIKSLWISNPKTRLENEAIEFKQWVKVRWITIIACLLYSLYFYNFNNQNSFAIWTVFFAIAGYEIAYSDLKKEINANKSFIAMESYKLKVNELFFRLYPQLKLNDNTEE